MQRKYEVAVVGATGSVGQTMLQVLEERQFPVARLVPLASSRSVGRTVSFEGKDIAVQDLQSFDFAGIDLALFSAGGSVSLVHAPRAAAAGAVVVDNTAAFRMDPQVPLVVPEVNPEACHERPKGIIANPNCSTIQMVLALLPLQRRVGIERIVVSTYQSVSGAGASAMLELQEATQAALAGQPFTPRRMAHSIAFNAIPQIDVFLEDGYTKEERKMMEETRKIFADPSIRVTATCVRVPVLRGHAEAVNVELKQAVDPATYRAWLAETPGVKVVDEPSLRLYPMQKDVAHRDEVLVGRIRRDPSCEKALDLWIVADNLRKGAATNAVQIAQLVFDANS
ncbi:MAG: aspartate-semialdehyde dehydrogenase [Myxococcota bacterium]|jgi:aspartate-semialdehyde dehydrogenase|nr:aspartate-semialdehyde dehydrogenase [Myxococcota bacterium]